MTQERCRAKNRLDAVFGIASSLSAEEEILSHWAKYLCVLTSGYVEVSMKAILMHYTRNRAHADVANFVDSRLEGITNLNEERIYQLLNSFNAKWAETFRLRRLDEQKDALDSVVSNRNLIAHGHSVGLTIARMRNYYRSIDSAVSLVESDCVM